VPVYYWKTNGMSGLFDLNRPDIQRSLKDAILWCADRQLTATRGDDEEIRRRRELMNRAQELLHGAMAESRSLLNRIRHRNYTELPKYQRGMELVSLANPVSFTSFTKRLRSPELQPSTSLSGAENPGFIVQSVISRRATLVNELIDLQIGPYRSDGRLMSYWPEENLACGGAEYASVGFFDVDNTPPWDTWVAFSGKTLLSWVPDELVGLASKGIEANPEACIAWYE
jgi:hypothetical protein